MSESGPLPLSVAQVGAGYWGLNTLRTLMMNPRVRVAGVFDADVEARERARARHGGVRLYTSWQEVLDDRAASAVLIATPADLHYRLASEALLSGKHVLVEKPMTLSLSDAERLASLADRTNLKLMVGHLFLYNNVVHDVKARIDRGELGTLHYVTSRRLNLGQFRRDSDVLWTLAPHDVSILNYWIGARPERVSARGLVCVRRHARAAEVAFAQLDYPGGLSAHLHLSWLDPQKRREMIVVGSQKMLVYDDLASDRHIQIFDKRVELSLSSPTDGLADFQSRIRAGDVIIPNVQLKEPLAVEIDHFVDSIALDHRPLTDGWHGVEIVAILEAMALSMEEEGRVVSVSYPGAEAMPIHPKTPKDVQIAGRPH